MSQGQVNDIKNNTLADVTVTMSQGQVIDIMTFNPYSLQYYSFWKGKIGFGFLKHEDCSCFLDNANSHQALQYNNITVSKNDFCVTVTVLQFPKTICGSDNK